MIDCTERRLPAAHPGLDREGQESMTKVAQS